LSSAAWAKAGASAAATSTVSVFLEVLILDFSLAWIGLVSWFLQALVASDPAMGLRASRASLVLCILAGRQAFVKCNTGVY
jgi:hypothetical protein